ncbi:hypothetical protein [Levilactobacillus angrenensis]|uniref:hypothetical protein n=1 Tax=Levilactobacillus angrenensis TaxID=2486020 RepID=UPI000F77EF52|nr:hypothetical protein [Levilactobacillus angrenensis]
MSNYDSNQLQLSLIAFTQAAKGIAASQKEYFDACIDNGFTESQALYLTYHYNAFLFQEGNYKDGSNDSDGDDGY